MLLERPVKQSPLLSKRICHKYSRLGTWLKTAKASCKLTSVHCKILEHIIVSTITQRQKKKRWRHTRLCHIVRCRERVFWDRTHPLEEYTSCSSSRFNRRSMTMKKLSWGMRCCRCTNNMPESAHLRCSQLGADCLGPVGDEKSGVRVRWLAYYHQNNIKSTTERYQDNRFNAMLQDASETHHHRAEISDFGKKLKNSNEKVCSVLLDLTDPINDPCSCSCLHESGWALLEHNQQQIHQIP